MLHKPKNQATYEHGDRVEFCWKGDIWLKGVVYAVYKESVLILADQPSQLYDRPFNDVRKKDVVQ